MFLCSSISLVQTFVGSHAKSGSLFQFGCLAGSPPGCLARCPAGWLAGWLAECPRKRCRGSQRSSPVRRQPCQLHGAVCAGPLAPVHTFTPGCENHAPIIPLAVPNSSFPLPGPVPLSGAVSLLERRSGRHTPCVRACVRLVRCLAPPVPTTHACAHACAPRGEARQGASDARVRRPLEPARPGRMSTRPCLRPALSPAGKGTANLRRGNPYDPDSQVESFRDSL